MSEEAYRAQAANDNAADDNTLVEAFHAGEKTAFDILVLRHQDKVFNISYRLLSNYEEADDCAQETFVKVYRSLNTFRGESKFSTWLYRIAVNTCKNWMISHRQSKGMVRLDNTDDAEEGPHSIQIADESLSPKKELERKEKETFIQRAIDSLPQEQKRVVILRDIEGLSYEEIADVTGYNIGTVKSKLARARCELRKKLKELI